MIIFIGIILLIGSSFFGFSFGQSMLLAISFIAIAYIIKGAKNKHDKKVEAKNRIARWEREDREAEREIEKKRDINKRVDALWKSIREYYGDEEIDGFGHKIDSLYLIYEKYFNRYSYKLDKLEGLDIDEWKSILINFEAQLEEEEEIEQKAEEARRSQEELEENYEKWKLQNNITFNSMLEDGISELELREAYYNEQLQFKIGREEIVKELKR